MVTPVLLSGVQTNRNHTHNVRLLQVTTVFITLIINYHQNQMIKWLDHSLTVTIHMDCTLVQSVEVSWIEIKGAIAAYSVKAKCCVSKEVGVFGLVRVNLNVSIDTFLTLL